MHVDASCLQLAFKQSTQSSTKGEGARQLLCISACLVAGAGSCGAGTPGRGGHWAAGPQRSVCGAAQEADHCCGAGGQPLHCLHGRAHLRCVTLQLPTPSNAAILRAVVCCVANLEMCFAQSLILVSTSFEPINLSLMALIC